MSPAASRTLRPRAVLIVTCVALGAVVSAVASLNVALPSIARDTHASQTQLSWIVDAYALVFASLLLAGGAIGDRYGRRRALLIGLTLFGAGSAGAMAATGPATLIVLRGVLGIGAALVMPATLATIVDTFPREQLGKAVGVWTGVAGGSAVLGLVVAGSLLEEWPWRAAFGLNVALAALALVGTLLVVPETSAPNAPRIDVGGTVIAVLGLAALVYSIIEAPDAGWSSARTLIGIAGGLLVLIGFVIWSLRRREPLLDPRLFRDRAFAGGALSITTQFFAMFGFIFILLQYLQLVRGDSTLIAALSLLPMAATLMPASRVSPHIAARLGARVVCPAGLGIAAVGMVELTLIGTSGPYGWLLLGLLTLGLGMGLAMPPATATIVDALPQEKKGVGSAVNDLSRELGGALGIAVLGSALQSRYRNHLTLHGLPAPVAAHARASLAIASRLGDPVAHQARTAFTDGMHTALILAAGVLVLTAAAVAILTSRRPMARDTNIEPTHEHELVR